MDHEQHAFEFHFFRRSGYPEMKTLYLILRWLARIAIVILVPFILIMTLVRLLLTPLFLQIEYRMPGFPLDPYGFTLQDRLQWSGYPSIS